MNSLNYDYMRLAMRLGTYNWARGINQKLLVTYNLLGTYKLIPIGLEKLAAYCTTNFFVPAPTEPAEAIEKSMDCLVGKEVSYADFLSRQ